MKTFKLIFLLIGIVTMNTACAATDYKQPLYSLEFHIYGAGAEIRLNDIVIHSQSSQGETTSTKPVPESIIDGKNILTIRAFPLGSTNKTYLKGAYIEAAITIKEKDAPPKESVKLLQIKVNPGADEGLLLDGTIDNLGSGFANILTSSELETIVDRSIYIDSSFPRWAWQDGKDIDDSPENFNSLLDVYKKIWHALQAGDIETIKKVYAPAAKEFAVAYHYQDINEGHRIINTGGLINDDDWKLGDLTKFLNTFNYRLEIQANKKIAMILDDKNRSPIVYLSRRAKMLNIQEFGFYKNKNNEWIMIR